MAYTVYRSGAASSQYGMRVVVAFDSDDPIVTLTGHVRRSVRDRFAAYARTLGLKPASLIRMFAEQTAGEVPAVPPEGSSLDAKNSVPHLRRGKL